jgi:hypothetical protein
VSVQNNISILFNLICGTIIGSKLGTILYTFYVSYVFDLIVRPSFVDDNFTIPWNMDEIVIIKRYGRRAGNIKKIAKRFGAES